MRSRKCWVSLFRSLAIRFQPKALAVAVVIATEIVAGAAEAVVAAGAVVAAAVASAADPMRQLRRNRLQVASQGQQSQLDRLSLRLRRRAGLQLVNQVGKVGSLQNAGAGVAVEAVVAVEAAVVVGRARAKIKAGAPAQAGLHNPDFQATGFARFSTTASTSGRMTSLESPNLAPTAENSSGSGREPPSERPFL